MTLVLKSVTTGNQLVVPWSQKAVDHLIRHGAELKESDKTKIIFFVDNPAAVHRELRKANVL